MSSDFHGAKLAVLSKGQVLAFLRDDRRDIPWPGMWDLPGGGRERARPRSIVRSARRGKRPG